MGHGWDTTCHLRLHWVHSRAPGHNSVEKRWSCGKTLPETKSKFALENGWLESLPIFRGYANEAFAKIASGTVKSP